MNKKTIKILLATGLLFTCLNTATVLDTNNNLNTATTVDAASSKKVSKKTTAIKTKYGSTYGTKSQAQYNAVMRKIDEFMKSDYAITDIEKFKMENPHLVDFYNGKRTKYTRDDFESFRVQEEVGFEQEIYESYLLVLEEDEVDRILVKNMSLNEYLKLKMAVGNTVNIRKYFGTNLSSKNVEDSAYQTLIRKQTDCGGDAYTSLAVLHKSGFKNVKYTTSSTHAWVDIKIGNKWYQLLS